jgi:predicted AAA+ superfamily ATPase
MIPRTLLPKLISLAEAFQVVTLTGPRQSGKTTLVRAAFPEMPYVSLEAPDMRQFALADPRGFLANYPNGLILDEVQRTPDLLSYIQTIVDENRQARFILTGSSNFLLMERLSQTLAGRTAILTLLPFSFEEAPPGAESYEERIFRGGYPPIYDRNLSPADFYPAYIQTYVEKDVRLVKNIGDLDAFIRFTQLCAGRIGQVLNYSSLASDAGLSPNTAKAWLSVLEAAYIIYRLQPFYRNFNKRLIKSPKLYFYDTGLACSLLGIRSAEQLALHYLKGALFENLILNEFIERRLHRGEMRFPYFWQDQQGREVDCLLEAGERLLAVEIKAGKTLSQSYFDNLNAWQRLVSTQAETSCYVIYGGETSLQTRQGMLVGWRELERIPW